MKKYFVTISTLLLIALLIYSSALRVSAHPGKTDGDGGHTDHDTGEYHYHHGYPAHSHYDMDGDGGLDCPYNFDDKTDHSPGTSSGNISGSITDRADGNSSGNISEYKPTDQDKEVKNVPAWVYWVIACLSCAIAALLFHIKGKNDQIERQKKRFQESSRKEIEKYQAAESEIRTKDKQIIQLNDHISNYDAKFFQLNRTISELNGQLEKIKADDKVPVSVMNDRIAALEAICQEKSSANALLREENAILRSDAASLATSLSKIKGSQLISEIQERYGITPEDIAIIPEDIYFINGIVPVSGIISDHRPYGNLTLYMADRGHCYHADYYCGNALLHAVHAYDVIGTMEPCRRCGYRFPVNKPPEWYIIYKQIIDDHGLSRNQNS